MSDYVSGLSLTYKPRLTLTLEISHAISAQATILTRSRITFVNVALTLGSCQAMNKENGKKSGQWFISTTEAEVNLSKLHSVIPD